MSLWNFPVLLSYITLTLTLTQQMIRLIFHLSFNFSLSEQPHHSYDLIELPQSEICVPEPDTFSTSEPSSTDFANTSRTTSSGPHKSRNSITQAYLEAPLYPGATVTTHATLLLLLAFVQCHNRTSEALADLLSLLNVTLLQPLQDQHTASTST